ncbi:carboxymuconolactone decarboxylase family protein [Streptacidiphilus pinicola]|uniref:Carboxymuconolactone decarboxylase family protein n=1 Tax=Streptacidiphilus pinicola TaxID=2219663 RepID=A0A2X0KJ31_9ACTN|nr:carboxymuconolactone decarboxylase family protein [Streptacidiphilus pinicola]RAG87009.1 carboxymuconolactone decarboxylase family protein [Streptacidiphilus pinicola]
MTTPFLPPIEKPRGRVLRLMFAVCRRQFGKVPTPFTVFSARMPFAFLSFYTKINRLDRKLTLPAETVVLVRERVAGTNGCLFCQDVTRWYALRKQVVSEERLDALSSYGTSPLFDGAERAALDYVGEVARDKHVRPETFERLARHYDERQICELVWLVASEHVYNITNHALNIGSDGFCELRPPRPAARAGSAS